jgi:hypothetical protein
MDHANAVLSDLVVAGLITAEERGRMTVGSCPRRLRDLRSFAHDGLSCGLYWFCPAIGSSILPVGNFSALKAYRFLKSTSRLFTLPQASQLIFGVAWPLSSTWNISAIGIKDTIRLRGQQPHLLAIDSRPGRRDQSFVQLPNCKSTEAEAQACLPSADSDTIEKSCAAATEEPRKKRNWHAYTTSRFLLSSTCRSATT